LAAAFRAWALVCRMRNALTCGMWLHRRRRRANAHAERTTLSAIATLHTQLRTQWQCFSCTPCVHANSTAAVGRRFAMQRYLLRWWHLCQRLQYEHSLHTRALSMWRMQVRRRCVTRWRHPVVMPRACATFAYQRRLAAARCVVHMWRARVACVCRWCDIADDVRTGTMRTAILWTLATRFSEQYSAAQISGSIE